MELVIIAAATGLPIRRIRYTVEHGLLPGAREASRGHRVPRTFTDFEAFGIAFAAALLHGGLRRPLVQRCVNELLKPSAARDVRNPVLWILYQSPGEVFVEVAQGEFLRVVGAGPKLSNWRPLSRVTPAPNLKPLVVLRLNAGALREALRTHPSRP